MAAKKSGKGKKASKSKAKKSAAKKPAAKKKSAAKKSAAKKSSTKKASKRATKKAKGGSKKATKAKVHREAKAAGHDVAKAKSEIKKAHDDAAKALKDLTSGHKAAAEKELRNIKRQTTAAKAELEKAADDVRKAAAHTKKSAGSKKKSGGAKKSKSKAKKSAKRAPAAAAAAPASKPKKAPKKAKKSKGKKGTAAAPSIPQGMERTGASRTYKHGLLKTLTLHYGRATNAHGGTIMGLVSFVAPLALTLFGVELGRRYFVTRAVTKDGKPFTGADAAVRISAPPTGKMYAIEAVGTIASLTAAGLLARKYPMIAMVAGGVATAGALLMGGQALMYEVGPRIANGDIGQRILPMEQLANQDAMLKAIADQDAALEAAAKAGGTDVPAGGDAGTQGQAVRGASGATRVSFLGRARGENPPAGSSTGHAPGSHVGCGPDCEECDECKEKKGLAVAGVVTAAELRASAEQFEKVGAVDAARIARSRAAEMDRSAPAQATGGVPAAAQEQPAPPPPPAPPAPQQPAALPAPKQLTSSKLPLRDLPWRQPVAARGTNVGPRLN